MATVKKQQPGKSSKDKAATSDVDPRLVKWLFFGVLGMLFLVGIIVMFQNLSSAPAEDPAEAMRRAMGITGDAAPTGAVASAYDDALNKAISSDQNVRLEGMKALMALDAEKGALALIQLLTLGEPAVKADACRILGQNASPGSGAYMAPLLNEPDPVVHTGAMEGLCALPEEPGIIYLLTTPLNSSDPAVVINALIVWKRHAAKDYSTALGMIPGPLSSDNEDVLLATMRSLNRVTPDDQKTMLPYLESIAQRKAGTPAGQFAAEFVAEINAYVPPPPQSPESMENY